MVNASVVLKKGNAVYAIRQATSPGDVLTVIWMCGNFNAGGGFNAGGKDAMKGGWTKVSGGAKGAGNTGRGG